MPFLETIINLVPGAEAVGARLANLLGAVPTGAWAALYFCWLVGSVTFLVMQRRSPHATLAWIFGFLLVPLVSAFIYMLFGPRKLRRRKRQRTLARQLAERSTPREPTNIQDQFASTVGFSDLALVATSRGDAAPARAERIALYDNGDDTYEAMESCMSTARQHIHLEYYIFEPDAIGQRWRELLTERAHAGVRVRVLVDALGSRGCTPAWWRPLTNAGGEVRYFNPPRLFKPNPGRVNFRTHRKIAVIDGVYAFTGGINVCKDNSKKQCGPSAWRDTHMRIDGPPASSLQTVFFEDWMFAADKNLTWQIANRDNAQVPNDIEQWFPVMPTATGPWTQIIDSGPDESMADIHRYFFAAIGRARHRVWITTPYFVPDDPILTALSTASARGVDTRVLMPRHGDSRVVSAAAMTFAEQAAREGTKVYTFGPGMNHAKTMLVDDELAIVGTANMDNRSFRLNFEVIAAVYDGAANRELADMFEADMKSATRLDPEQSPAGLAGRLTGSAARLFAPLL